MLRYVSKHVSWASFIGNCRLALLILNPVVGAGYKVHILAGRSLHGGRNVSIRSRPKSRVLISKIVHGTDECAHISREQPQHKI